MPSNSVDDVLGCAVCSEPLSSVGVLYNGSKLVRILACDNGHFVPAMTPQENVAWTNLSLLVRFTAKLQDSDLLTSDMHDLWTRRGDTWGRTKIPDVSADALNPGQMNPCPFCRSTSTLVVRDTDAYFLYCRDCDVYGPEAAELSVAVANGTLPRSPNETPPALPWGGIPQALDHRW